MLAAGTAVRVGRNAFDVLVVLVERSGHLVTKDPLFERVWPKLVVEENTLQSHVSALRKILERLGIAGEHTYRLASCTCGSPRARFLFGASTLAERTPEVLGLA